MLSVAGRARVQRTGVGRAPSSNAAVQQVCRRQTGVSSCLCPKRNRGRDKHKPTRFPIVRIRHYFYGGGEPMVSGALDGTPFGIRERCLNMKAIVAGFSESARIALYGSVAVIGLAIPSVAFAQTAPSNEAQPATDRAPAADEQTGNEIIVTATKREQTLQSTPVAVSVTTAETIERAQIRDITDLQSVVPSLRVSQSQSQFATTYAIRGFGTSGNNLGLEPSVAVFVDGVYRSRAIAQISDLPDIQRVEVLRGPQSTLFGKNASAGVISIITRLPQFKFGGNVEASYGNFNAVVVKGVVTGPISSTVAASLAAGYNRRDGYLSDLGTGTKVNNRNRYFVRGQLLFEPTDALKVRLIGDYDRLDEICCGVSNLRTSAATGAVIAVGGKLNDFRTPFNNQVYSSTVPFSKVENFGFSGQIDYTAGPLTLTSITAYRQTKINANQDVDFTSADIASGANIGQAKLKTFTQEVRVASDLQGPINFILGGYFFKEKVDTADQIIYGSQFRNYINVLLSANGLSAATLESLFGAAPGSYFAQGQGIFNHFYQDDKSYSGFGQVDFKPIDRVTLTFGANYTHDSKDVRSQTVSTDKFSAVNLVTAGAGAVRAIGISNQVGAALGLGRGASAAEIGAFAGAQPAIFGAINAGVTAFANANAANPAVNSFLGLRPLQFQPPFLNIPNAIESGRTRDGNWSYTARLAVEVTDHINAYLSYSTGFKASSFNLSRDSKPTPADLVSINAAGLGLTNLASGSRFARPEKSRVLELGIKGNWRYASANLTFFKQSIKDFQTNTFTGVGFILSNADKQSTLGVEFDGRVNPTRELTLSLAMTYLDPKYDKFTNSAFGDISGTRVGNIPRLGATFGIQYNQPLANDDHFILAADFHYESPVQVEAGLLNYIGTNPNGTPNYAPARIAAQQFRHDVQDLNGSLTYQLHNGLELSVWGRNLLNQRYVADIFDSVAQSQSISGYVNQPRTYGVAARFKF